MYEAFVSWVNESFPCGYNGLSSEQRNMLEAAFFAGAVRVAVSVRKEISESSLRQVLDEAQKHRARAQGWSKSLIVVKS